MKEEILEFLKLNKKYEGLEGIVVSRISLCIAKSGDSNLFSELPEPIKTKVIEHGLSIKDSWYEVSSNGTTDYSKYASILHRLTKEYMNNTPLGKYIY